jgi:hypothetical protein
MNVVNFEQKSCERIRGLLDAYVSNELLVETNLEVLRHLNVCTSCGTIAAERARVKRMLKQAVGSENAPAALRSRIQREIQATRPARSNWVLAAAAAIVLGLGGYMALQWFGARQMANPHPALAAVLRVGLDDHIHCAVGTWYRGREFSDERMARDLGPQFAGLAPMVKSVVPADMKMLVAHQCQVNGRNFVHFILQKQDRTFSLIITRKDGESFTDVAGGSSLNSGVRIHESRMQNFEVAGTETRDFLVYFISDSTSDQNSQIARNLAAPVRGYLARLEAA